MGEWFTRRLDFVCMLGRREFYRGSHSFFTGFAVRHPVLWSCQKLLGLDFMKDLDITDPFRLPVLLMFVIV
jgi:hypothetical protein